MRQDAADNREAIVAAARQLLIDEGPGVSLRTIAKAASVGVATASRHFPERIELLDAIGARAAADINEIVERHLGEFGSDARSAWRGAVHEIGNLQLAVVAQAIITDTMQNPETLSRRGQLVESRMAEIRDVYDRLLVPAKNARLCPADLDPLEFHMGLGVITRPLPAGVPVPVDVDQLAASLIDIALDGLELRAQAK